MSMRNAAVKLAEKGFKVFLLGVESKIPVIEVVTDKAINDPEKVYETWSDPFGDSRDNNVGLNTDNLLILDFDATTYPELMEQEFAAFHKFFKFRHVVKTARGGYHAYLRLPCGVRCAGKVKLKGLDTKCVDTRSWHNYVAGPGSSFEGGEYRWIVSDPSGHVEPKSIDDLAIAPQELIDACGAPAERKERPTNIELDTPAAISQVMDYLINNAPVARQGEGGDHTTYSVACRVREFGVSSDKALELMSELWNETKAVPPWALEELERKVENAYQYAKNAPHVPGSEFEPVDIGKPILEAVSAKATKKKKIHRESFDDAADNAVKEMKEPLVHGLIECDTLVVIYGASNAGKSFIAIELARCVAMGERFAGRRCERGAVLYFALEAHRNIRKRFATVRKHKANGAKLPLALCSGRINLFAGDEDLPEIIQEIRDVERELGVPVKLVIFDTLTKAASGAEQNGAKDMSLVMDRAEAIKNETGACVSVVHHAGKDLSRGMRGSTTIEDAVDTVLSVEAKTRKPGETPGGKIVVDKQRDLEFARDIHYSLPQKEFWTNGETLEVHHSCVVEFLTTAEVDAAANPPSRVMLDRWEAFELAASRVGANEWVRLDDIHKAAEEQRAREGEPVGSTKDVRKRREALRAAATRMCKDGKLDSKGMNWRKPAK